MFYMIFIISTVHYNQRKTHNVKLVYFNKIVDILIRERYAYELNPLHTKRINLLSLFMFSPFTRAKFAAVFGFALGNISKLPIDVGTDI